MIPVSLLLALSLPATAAPAGGKVISPSTRPTNAEQAAAERSTAAAARRAESISMLEDMVGSGRLAGEAKYELWLRLASLYEDESRALRLAADERWITEIDACSATAGCRPEQLVADHAEADRFARKAERVLRVLSAQPTWARADEATAHLAAVLELLDEDRAALDTHAALVRTWPESPFAGVSWLSLAEARFEQNQAFPAYQAYQRAVRLLDAAGDAELADFARYKLAWAQYNLGELEAGQRTLEQALDIVLARGNPAAPLVDELIRDAARFAAEGGDLDRAEAVLRRHGRTDRVPELWKRMAAAQQENGDTDGAVATWRRLVAVNPTAPEAAGYQAEVVAARLARGQRDALLSELDRLRRETGPGSAWARAQADEPDLLAEAAETESRLLRKAALAEHELCRKKRGRSGDSDCAAADSMYTAWRESAARFPDAAAATADVVFAHAELRWQLGQLDAAWRDYTWVATEAPGHAKARFCAEAAMHAAEAMVKRDGDGGRTETEAERRLVASADHFAAAFPDDPLATKATYRAAYTLYGNDRFSEAATRFRSVIAAEPASTEAELAADLVLDSLSLVEDWDGLAAAAAEFAANEQVGSRRFRDETRAVQARAEFKRIEVGGRSPDPSATLYSEQGAAWLAWVAHWPDADVADRALNNAAFSLQQAGDRSAALEARLRLVTEHPTSPLVPQQLAAIGFAYEAQADFAAAADWYERLVDAAPDHPSSRAALYSAALFRWALGEPDAAVADYERLVAQWPDDARTPGILLDAARIRVEQGRPAQAAELLDRLVGDHPDAAPDLLATARFEWAAALRVAGQDRRAARAWDEAVAFFSAARVSGAELPDATRRYAEGLHAAGEPERSAFAALRVTGPGPDVPRAVFDRTLRDQLAAKARALATVEQNTASVTAAGSGLVARDALTDLGGAYEQMAAALRGAPVPPWLTPSQAELYRLAIEDQAAMFDAKAAAAYGEAVAISHRLQLYGDETEAALSRLAALDAEAEGPPSEVLPEARFMARPTTRFEPEP